VNSADLDRILKRVRTLISKAENLSVDADKPTTSETDAAAFRAEADAARTMADALILQYQIQEIGEEEESGTRSKPMILTVNIGQDSDVLGYVAQMASDLAKHCRCRIRLYTSWTTEGYNAKVYGFESDVRYFDIMYTSVRLHMLGVLLPRINTSESLEENAYRLHNSGYNWLQIAEMYGWKSWKQNTQRHFPEYPPADMKVPYWHKDEGWQPATQVGSRIKRAYHRACAQRGETVQKIAANGTDTYRKSAAYGYTAMIRSRLYQMSKQHAPGAALILASRVDDLDALFREDNPDLFKEPDLEPEEGAKKRKGRAPRLRTMTINQDAYRRGTAHAQTADLNAHSKAEGGSRREVGQ
jgi:hypothetical protein